MSLVNTYITSAKQQTAGTFSVQFSAGFLLYRPVVGTQDSELEQRLREYSSGNYQATAIAAPVSAAQGEIDRDVNRWIVVAISKRDGIPDPTTITLGRAPTCDLVLPFQSISKVHARFAVVGIRVKQLTDCGSTNGTFINRIQLQPEVPTSIKYGDVLTFGQVELRFVPASVVYCLLTAL